MPSWFVEDRTSSRRTSIVRAALQRFRTHAVSGTTLRDLAHVAEMPIGNLYYYFRSRDDLLLAVLEECEKELDTLLNRWAPLAPQDWLAAYFDWLLLDPDGATALGCPFGTLPGELRALGHPAAERGAQLVRRYRHAVVQQTTAAGLETDVFMAVQGVYTVSRILGDATLFKQSIQQIRDATLSSQAAAKAELPRQ